MRLFDLHCDTLGLGTHGGASIAQHTGALDLHRGKGISPWVQAFAAFIPDGLTPAQAFCECELLLNTALRWEKEHLHAFRIVRTEDKTPEQTPLCRSLLTVENGGALGENLSLIDWLYQRHVRMVGLTWNGDNAWASGCGGTANGGLTACGKQAVHRLEQQGIVVDVSHLNTTGFWQVAEMAQRPFVASHSNAMAMCSHPRNLTDEQFLAIRDCGGLVGVNLYPAFLGGEELWDIQRHIEHFLSLDGEKTVCFGADFDGMTAPAQWNGLCVMKALWKHLYQQGYPRPLLEDIFYNNAQRLFLPGVE